MSGAVEEVYMSIIISSESNYAVYCSIQECAGIGVMLFRVIKVHIGIGWASIVTAYEWSSLRHPLLHCRWIVVHICPACRTYEIATRFWMVMICPIIKCLTVLEFSFILFDLCLFIIIFNFILNCVLIVTFWIFTYHKIWILLIVYCFIWNYWIIYFCLEVFWRVVS